MGFRDQVKATQARRQSEYITAPGRYLLEIKDFVEGENRKGREFVAAEFIVIDAEDTDSPKGSERTWLTMTDTDTAAKNIRGFICNVLDIPDSALTDEMIDRAFEKDEDTGRSHLAGIKVYCNARVITTRKGNPFTLCDFRSAPEDAEQLD